MRVLKSLHKVASTVGVGGAAGAFAARGQAGAAIRTGLIMYAAVIGIAIAAVVLIVFLIVRLIFAFLIGGGAIAYGYINPQISEMALGDIGGLAHFLGWAAIGLFFVCGSLLSAGLHSQGDGDPPVSKIIKFGIGGGLVGAASYLLLSSLLFYAFEHNDINSAIQVVQQQEAEKEQQRQAELKAQQEREEAEARRQSLMQTALKLLGNEAFPKIDMSTSEPDAARVAFNSGDFVKAWGIASAASSNGNDEILCILATASNTNAHWAGQIAQTAGLDNATRCINAANAGYPSALMQMSYLFEKGTYFDRKPDAADGFLQLASKNGDPEALTQLAEKDRSARHYPEALEGFLKAVDLGSAKAAMNAADMIRSGQGAQPDPRQMVDLASRSLKLAVPGRDDESISAAHLMIGKTLLVDPNMGSGLEQNDALTHLIAAANGGSAEADQLVREARLKAIEAERAAKIQQIKAETQRIADEQGAAEQTALRDKKARFDERMTALAEAAKVLIFPIHRKNVFEIPDIAVIASTEQKAFQLMPGQEVTWLGPMNRSGGVIKVLSQTSGGLCKKISAHIRTPIADEDSDESFCQQQGVWQRSP